MKLVSRIARLPSLFVSLLMIINGMINIVAAIALILNFKGFFNLFVDYASFTGATAPPVQQANTVLSIIIGFVLILLGAGLYRRRRTAWWLAIITLSLLTTNNAYPILKLKLLVLSAISLVILILSYRVFRAKSEKLKYGQIVALGAIIFAFCYGIFGAYILRAQFQGIHTLTDAVYYTVVTFSTVGYGDITPQTENARLFVATMVIIGLGAFATAVSVFVAPFVEREIKGVFSVMKKISALEKHIILCGFNETAKQIIEDISAKGQKYLVIEADINKAKLAEEMGFKILIGNATSSITLNQASVHTAKTIICLDEDDAKNILIAITVNECLNDKKKLKTKPKLMAKIDSIEHLKKASLLGIDHAFSPAALSGHFVMGHLD